MNQNRKYFGMTGSQIGILAGLTLLVICLFSLMGWLIFGDGINFSRPPENTLVPQFTPTLIVIPTFTPTALPTPIPYEQLIPNGWKQYRTALIEIWLPPTYKTAKLEIPEGSSGLAFPELVLSQPASGSSVYNEWFIVSYEPLTGDSLDSYLDAELQKLSPEIRLVERRKVWINSTEAMRLLFETRVENNIDANVLTFVFLDGTTIWYVEYLAQINEFYEMLETFEDSVQTFRVVR